MSDQPLKITIPGYYDREVAYVLHVCLTQHLGIEKYILERRENTDFIFEGPEGNLSIANTFFSDISTFPFHPKNIPSQFIEVKVPGFTDSVCVLFGNDQVVQDNNDIFLGGDMISSIFLLLTQWDASVSVKDNLGRVKLNESAVGKLGLYHRPLVNEYIACLRYLLNRIGIQTKTREYQPVFSCDVDSVQKYKNIRNLAGAIYNSDWKWSEWQKIRNRYFKARKNIKEDPYFSFDYLLTQLKCTGLEATFYFMTGTSHRTYDHKDYELNDMVMSTVVREIQSKGYHIGLHPSFESWTSMETLIHEKSKLDNATGKETTKVRQHYLRYQPGKTWTMQEEAGFLIDSSVQYTEGMGFAAGICTPYQLYDLQGRRMLHLTEEPLILMKKKDYVRDVESQFLANKKILDQAKKHNGRFQILFHNSDVETENERTLFEETLKYLAQKP